MLLTSNPGGSTFTEEEKTAVLEQLERLLANPFFSHSKRFPALLRFVVESTLAGSGEQLKERTLGVEVFGKSAHYDTANDPIVRVTAAEIRKRIALYYQEPGHEAELRLTLPPGSYVPHFEPPRTGEPALRPPVRRSEAVLPPLAAESVDLLPAALLRPVPERAGERLPSTEAAGHSRSRRLLPLAAAIALILLMAVGLVWWKSAARSPVKEFWAPLLGGTDPVLFCVADQTEYTDIQLRDAAEPSHQSVLRDNLTAVVIDDLAPIVDIAGILRQNGKSYTLRGEGVTTLNDLRSGPAIFIGAYDNAWTLRLLEPLRFHFANNADMTRFWIVDRTAKQPSPWVVDRKAQIATNIYRDYAIVARFTDTDTGRLSVVVAGIGRGGTIAAGELLTSPALLSEVERLTRSADKKNIELVLSTQIIGGEPGTPRIEASYIW